jgi:hypothetical protein
MILLSPFEDEHSISKWHETAAAMQKHLYLDQNPQNYNIYLDFLDHFRTIFHHMCPSATWRKISFSLFYNSRVCDCNLRGYKQVATELFIKAHGYPPNLEEPRSFNEKLTCIKLADQAILRRNCSDKLIVRNYVDTKLGQEYLIPLYCVLEDITQFNPATIKNKSFVVRASHDSGSTLFCPNRMAFNWKKARDFLDGAISRDYSYFSCELQYKNLCPKILVQKLLPSSELIELQFSCFSGEPELVGACVISSFESYYDIYDMHWKPLPILSNYLWSACPKPRPSQFSECVEVVKVLSKPFSFARIDLLLSNDKIYFLEITLTPHAGLKKIFPHVWDLILGELLEFNDDREAANNG